MIGVVNVRKNDDDVVLVTGARTPFGRFGGLLRDFDCYELGAIAMREAVARSGLAGEAVDEVFWGVGDTSPCKDVYTPVVARQSLLQAGLPAKTVSCSLDKACVSATSAILLGCRAIRCGDAEVVLAGGVTTFSQEPLILRGLRWNGYRLGSPYMEDPLFALGYKDFNPVAVDAGQVALEHGIGRAEQDAWAVRSHRRYGEALQAGKFKEEIIPLAVPGPGNQEVVLEADEQYRPDINEEKLARLPTIYGSPTVTAGNSPGLNDGATAVLLMRRGKARELALSPLATIIAAASVAAEPRLLAEAPALAARKALQKAGLAVSDIKLWEINEAFAAVTLTSGQMLAEAGNIRWAQLQENLNVNGGAIAIGHPNTASGARLVMTLAYELRRRGGGYGLAAICGGLAQGDAIILEIG